MGMPLLCLPLSPGASACETASLAFLSSLSAHSLMVKSYVGAKALGSELRL